MTFYYCHDSADGPVRVIVAAIANTPRNERYSCVLAVADTSEAGPETPYRFDFTTRFHVSPFMPMDF